MKLTSAWVDQTQNQFKVQMIPDDHPSAHKLSEVFGDHTFFLGESGLHIVEPAAAVGEEAAAGKVVKLAGWNDRQQNTLEPQDPEIVGMLVVPDAGAGRA
jgi:hypothetical protein